MIQYLPVFYPTKKEYSTESLKAINIRMTNFSNMESRKIILTLIPVENISRENRKEKTIEDKEKQRQSALRNVVGKFQNQAMSCHIGIGLFDSKDTNSVNIPNDFLLISPLVSANFKQNSLIFVNSEWETAAIKRKLIDSKISEKDMIIITDLPSDHSYIQLYVNQLRAKSLNIAEKIPEDVSAFLIVGENKWNIIRSLENKIQGKIIITTSSFEDWKVPTPIRRIGNKNVLLYTYPKITENSKPIIDKFKEEFGYKPSIYSLLTYDGADIAIKILLEAGPEYGAMKKYIMSNDFETIALGKIGFSDDWMPYLVGGSLEKLFEIKYIDEKGQYKTS